MTATTATARLTAARLVAAALLLALLFSPGSPGRAQIAGDAQAGQRLFSQCRACHQLDRPDNGIGPTLSGLFGRPAGAVAEYSYSSSMGNAAIIWNTETLTRFLANPGETIPGNRMPFVGMRDAQQLADLIAYLQAATAPPE